MSNTRAAASLPLSTPDLRATIMASPMRSASITDLVVTSISRSPRSSARAAATTRSRSGFDETIGLLPQAEGLLRQAKQVCALAADATFLAGRLDHTAVDNPPPEVASIDRKTKHRLIDVL